MEISESQSVNRTAPSLPLGNVQELASHNLKEIPSRYIRPEMQTDVVSVNESSQIPVIDLRKLEAGDAGYQTEMSKLHQACKDWGFFLLTHHGATSTIEKMKVDLQQFFKLPLQEKKIYAKLPNNPEGYGQALVFSDDHKLDWNDMLYIYSLPESSRNMRFWPNNPSSFRFVIPDFVPDDFINTRMSRIMYSF
ncbi:OLC1v1031401C1 [Oldenlandia corymbosa var. corymbosa]|uniref:OLC1v1031401C1 n=1 Tax=Oldenlandia corymbosa var. corymbosa TaxID=529605 RepID=A0AAV1CLR9_OLDCO|nr:OLC1v1031401C1 [Oldenlandia corymbosa var. corymbosa]